MSGKSLIERAAVGEHAQEFDLGPFLRREAQIAKHEGQAIWERWESGRELLARRVGKKLPAGLLDQLVEATGQSRTEWQYRTLFAARYATEDALLNAVEQYGSWHVIVNEALGNRVPNLDGSTTVECYTPEVYVEAARAVLGQIDLDPASCEEANAVIGASTIYTAGDDGLAHEWHGTVWLNPPYGRSLTSEFVSKLVAEYEAGRTTAAIVLLNAYGFDAAWFQPLWGCPMCFTDHRIPFYGGGPTFGSLFVYLGPHPARFVAEFAQFGAVGSLHLWRGTLGQVEAA